MKYLIVPETIEVNIKNLNKSTNLIEILKVSIPFSQFVLDSVLPDQKFGHTMARILACIELKSIFKDCKPGDIIPIEDKNVEILKSIVEEPSNGYNTEIITQLYLYLTTLTNLLPNKPEQKV